MEDAERKWVESIARTTVRQSYHLLFLTRDLVKLLEEAGIPALVLKGCGVAELYPVPELRKSGDIDVLIPGNCVERAAGLLEKRDSPLRKPNMPTITWHLVPGRG